MNKNTSQARHAALSAFAGTTLEFYDYYVYALASTLVLGKVFFSSQTTLAADLASYGTLAAGFLARPLAGVVFGTLGDMWGRKKVLTITVVLMGFATMGIGLLPSYTTIGIGAPIALVLLRILQGISVGGEWGGGVLMASEHAASGWKTFAASFAQLGSPAGMLMALSAFRLANSFGEATFFTWAWRVPFLLGGVLALTCFLLRRKLTETPDFLAALSAGQAAFEHPLKKLNGHWLRVFYAGAAVVIGSAGFFFMNTFLLGYATRYVHLPSNVILNALFVATCFQLLTQPLAAFLAEKTGELPFLLSSAALCILMPYPVFFSLQSHNLVLISCTITLAIVTLSAFYAVIAGYIVHAFPVSSRYTAISIAYQSSAALVSGFTPLIGTLIASHYAENWFPLALFFSTLALISILGVVGLNQSNKT
ncbi:LysR family transcriptional regulator [Acetobacter malorum]|uniref:LysR family transcriptional regulator n=1 Tax=Acetobacter malorum TaxID=178901 RepID=A0A149RYF4_9PROT|nr:MFS transporter [Acetobacter malorum]KXV19504.1 LysR family transcriptional regulator [Acetobacter malorum]